MTYGHTMFFDVLKHAKGSVRVAFLSFLLVTFVTLPFRQPPPAIPATLKLISKSVNQFRRFAPAGELFKDLRKSTPRPFWRELPRTSARVRPRVFFLGTNFAEHPLF